MNDETKRKAVREMTDYLMDKVGRSPYSMRDLMFKRDDALGAIGFVKRQTGAWAFMLIPYQNGYAGVLCRTYESSLATWFAKRRFLEPEEMRELAWGVSENGDAPLLAKKATALFDLLEKEIEGALRKDGIAV